MVDLSKGQYVDLAITTALGRIGKRESGNEGNKIFGDSQGTCENWCDFVSSSRYFTRLPYKATIFLVTAHMCVI